MAQIPYFFNHNLCLILFFQALSLSKEKYPIFTFVEGRGQNFGLEEQSGGPVDSTSHILPFNRQSRSNKRGSADDFVLL